MSIIFTWDGQIYVMNLSMPSAVMFMSLSEAEQKAVKEDFVIGAFKNSEAVEHYLQDKRQELGTVVINKKEKGGAK